MSDVNFKTGASFEEGRAVLSPVIQEIRNDLETQVGLKDQMSDLGFVEGEALTPSGEITGMVGPEELDDLTEDGVASLDNSVQGWTSRYELKGYALKHKCTKLFSKWIEQGAQLEGADSSVKKELNAFRNNIERLVKGSILTRNRVMTEVFTKGFVNTEPSGPGKKMGDGEALFSTAHKVKVTPSVTFSNRMAAGKALTATTLAEAVNMFKTSIKMPNGYRISTAPYYTLMVGRDLEQTARKILNSTSSQAGMFAGTGSNANLLNEFNFEGSKIKLVVLELIGEKKKDGTTIGNDAMWFLAHDEYNKSQGAFRLFTLWDNELNMWKDNDTQSVFTQIDTWFSAEAINFEGIIGYAGD